MRVLCCLLEEASAKCMLEAVLPRIIPNDISVRYMVFEGKQDLDRNVELKILAWNVPNTVFLVLRDKDSANCVEIKNRLIEKIKRTGKQDHALVRIACCELETFYLGDLFAVEKGMGLSNLAKMQRTHKYRTPDALGNAAQELKLLTKDKYQKINGSRSIAPYLDLNDVNCSHSFKVLISGVKKLIRILEAV